MGSGVLGSVQTDLGIVKYIFTVVSSTLAQTYGRIYTIILIN